MMLKGDIDIHPYVADPEHVPPLDLGVVIELVVEPVMMLLLSGVIYFLESEVVPVLFTGEK